MPENSTGAKIRKGLDALSEIRTSSADISDAYVALFGALKLKLRSGNSVLVTSTQPGEGKTTVASCLAITASLAGEKVLLIDGDLRRASLGSALSIADDPGLAEVLTGKSEAAEVIQSIVQSVGSSQIGLVSVMGGGRQSAATLPAVDWAKARTLFRSIAQSFGLVLVDSPPILAANDAPLLASMLDEVLLIVDAETANLDDVRTAKQRLEQSGKSVIGIVLNRFDPKIQGPGLQPYRGYEL